VEIQRRDLNEDNDKRAALLSAPALSARNQPAFLTIFEEEILMMMHFISSIAIALWLALPTVNIAGKWQAEFDTMLGKQAYVYAFQVDGDKISGTAEATIMGEKKTINLKDVKLTGDELTFTESIEAMGTTTDAAYKGKVSENEIKFTRQVGSWATEEATAKRVP
jgi:hypothetical protein